MCLASITGLTKTIFIIFIVLLGIRFFAHLALRRAVKQRLDDMQRQIEEEKRQKEVTIKKKPDQDKGEYFDYEVID